MFDGGEYGLPAVAAAALLAAVVSAWLSYQLSRNAVGFLRIVDHPNERSLHRSPVPRTGGVAVLVAAVIGMSVALLGVDAEPRLGWIAVAVLLVGAVSLVDDVRDVAQAYRLATHLAAAMLICLGGLQWWHLGLPGIDPRLPFWVACPLSLLYIVWMINLYNFMDGMDGFAGGMALFGFGALAVLGWQGGALTYAALAAVIAAAAAGFLTRNWPPARIFLGDVGSSVLGLLAAVMTLWGADLDLFPLWVGWLIFSPFIVDATWTLLRRVLAGEPFWRAHRSHHYQRLVLAGWGHRRTLLWAYVLMAAAAVSGVAAVDKPEHEQWLLLLGWVAIYALVHVRVELAERAVDAPAQ